MSNISPISIQQILQMGSHTEKLQQTIQNLPHAIGQQQNEERKVADEAKRTSVQNMDNSNSANSINPDGAKKKRLRVRRKAIPATESEETCGGKFFAESRNQGNSIDLIV